MTVAAPARRRRTAAAWLAGAGAGTVADLALDPVHRHVPLCPFHALTGWQCPLCGGLRAVWTALHGQWRQAWHDDALLWLSLPVVAACLTLALCGRPVRIGRSATVALVAVAAVFTVLRNAVPALGLLPV